MLYEAWQQKCIVALHLFFQLAELQTKDKKKDDKKKEQEQLNMLFRPVQTVAKGVCLIINYSLLLDRDGRDGMVVGFTTTYATVPEMMASLFFLGQ